MLRNGVLVGGNTLAILALEDVGFASGKAWKLLEKDTTELWRVLTFDLRHLVERPPLRVLTYAKSCKCSSHGIFESRIKAHL